MAAAVGGRHERRARSPRRCGSAPSGSRSCRCGGVLVVDRSLVFSLLVDDYLTGRFFNRVTTSVAITAVLAVAQTPGHPHPQHRPVGRLDRRASPPTSPASSWSTTTTPRRCSPSAWRWLLGCGLGLVNGAARRLREGAGDRRHAGHAGHLPQLADRPRRRPDDHRRLAARLGGRPAAADGRSASATSTCGPCSRSCWCSSRAAARARPAALGAPPLRDRIQPRGRGARPGSPSSAWC